MKKLSDNTFPKWNDWLRINAERHFLEKKRRYAWKGVAGAHDPRNTLSGQISLFYKELPSEQQILFREGLVNCLLTLPQEQNYLDIFLVFIQLCIECNCYEIVESSFFEKIIFKGRLGFLNQKVNNSNDNICIYQAVIRALRYFSKYGTGKHITKICKKMVSSPYFPPKHIYLVFLILCKAQPNKLFENWKIIRNIHFSFYESMSKTKKAYTAYPVLQAELTKIINIQDIRDFSSKIKTLDDYQLEDEWLIHLLHEKNNGSLKIRQKEKEIVFEPSSGILPAESIHTPRRLKEGFIKVVSKKSPFVIKLYEKGEITPYKIIIAFMRSEYDIDSESESVFEFQDYTLNEMAKLNKKYASEGVMV